MPTLSVISPLADSKILGGVSPLLSSWKNQKLIISSTTEAGSSTSASSRSSDTSPGRSPNHSATGESLPETVTVPEPLPDVNGTTTETSSIADGAEDAETVGAAEAVVATFGEDVVVPPLLSSLSLLPDEQLAARKTTARAAADKNFTVFITEPLLLRYYKINSRHKTANVEHAKRRLEVFGSHESRILLRFGYLIY